MAEGITSRLLKGEVAAFSAGTSPARVHPLAIRALAEAGIDITSSRSKHVDEFRDRHFDLVITLCDGARESCPIWPGQDKRIHFGLDDPAQAAGAEEDRFQAFRKVRDRIIHELIPLVKRELGLRES